MIRVTLAREVTVAGRGLFTGKPVGLTIRPGRDGVRFLITDPRGRTQIIPADIGLLSATPPIPGWPADAPPRNTTVAVDTAAVTTTEHLLSALAGLGVTDADCELDASEPPIGDGSALLFAEPIDRAGLTELGSTIEPIEPTQAITVSDDRGATITIEPAPALSVRYELDYGHDSPIKPHAAEWNGATATYLQDIAPARTFCLEAEAHAMQAAGLFADITPRDLLVIGPNGPIDNAYRSPNEPAAHKLLDLIGDLALAGRPIVGRIMAQRSGHALNHTLASQLRAL